MSEPHGPSKASPLVDLDAAMPISVNWVFADEALREALENEQPVRRQAVGRLLYWMVRVSDAFFLSSLMVALVAGVDALLIYRRQLGRPKQTPPVRGRLLSVFVGFGAKVEEDAFRDFLNRSEGDVCRINLFRIPETGDIGRPGVIDLWRAFKAALKDFRIACRALPPQLRARRSDLLATTCRRIGPFTYEKAWWHSVRSNYDHVDACFLTPDTTPAAAISEEIECTFVQHGLISTHLVFPAFSQVHSLSLSETAHLRERLAQANVTTQWRYRQRDGTHTRRLLVLSGDYTAAEMDLMRPLVEFAVSAGLEVHVRLFPGEPIDRYWGRGSSDLPLHFTSSGQTFQQTIDIVRPLLVASWSSTTLAESLYLGTIPISVLPGNSRHVRRPVFPLLRCCLFWPKDAEIISRLVREDSTYEATLRDLRSAETDRSTPR